MSENITYEKIIQYLCPNEKKFNTNFPNKPNLIVSFDEFPDQIKQFFNKNFFRYGVRTHNKEGENISFMYSILCILDRFFLTYTQLEQETRINYVKQFLIDELVKSGTYQKYGYNYTGLTKTVIIEKIKEKLTPLTIQIFSDLFKINIITINFDSGEKYIYFNGKELNVFHPTIILSHQNEFYEPILHKRDKKYYTYNDKIIERLLINVKTKQIASLEKELILNNNIINIVNDMFKKDTCDDEQETSVCLDKYKTMTESKLNKKRKTELLDIAKDLQLNLGDLQTKTKTQIILTIQTTLNIES
jgi:hypothetical protein